MADETITQDSPHDSYVKKICHPNDFSNQMKLFTSSQAHMKWMLSEYVKYSLASSLSILFQWS